ncbi:MAG: hypothetical protein ACLP01_33030 [Solirubrobacteraceae bacterium]
MVDTITTTALVAKTGQEVVTGPSEALEFFDKVIGTSELPGSIRSDKRLTKRLMKQVSLLLEAKAGSPRRRGRAPRSAPCNEETARAVFVNKYFEALDAEFRRCEPPPAVELVAEPPRQLPLCIAGNAGLTEPASRVSEVVLLLFLRSGFRAGSP